MTTKTTNTGISIGNSSDIYGIQPSDVGQSLVRIAFVTGVLAWSFYISADIPYSDLFKQDVVILSLSYWGFSGIYLCWSIRLQKNTRTSHTTVDWKRILGAVADLGAISAYTSIADSHGLILFPLYLTTIIGYGYRFGIGYLYFCIIAAVVLFSIALFHNSFLHSQLPLALAYYIGLILVPLYSSSLLKKHRLVVRRLKEVNDARSRFIANMSHELRTPLHAIISVTDVLTEQATQDTINGAKYEEKLALIGESAQLLLGLVNHVLDIASSEAGVAKSEPLKTIDLYNTIAKAIAICRPNAEEKRLQFFWYIDPQVPRGIVSSDQYLAEILINTIGNAVKYSSSGHVYVRITADHSRRTDNRVNVLFEILDTGVGISPSLLPTIFEPFTIGDDSAARRYTGTGLGLTITKQYVDHLHGSIHFESKEGVGTCCRVTIPFMLAALAAGLPVRKRPCALITSRRIGRQEVAEFSEANWSLEPLGLMRAISISALEQAEVIFVDDALGDRCTVALNHVRTVYSSKPIILYSNQNTPVESLNLLYQSRAKKGVVDDLKAVYDISNCSEQRKDDHDLYRNKKYTVLIADDNQTNLQTAVMALRAVTSEIDTVRSGEEALDALERKKYDLALLDVHMPGMSGTEAASIYQFMRTDDPTPIVLLSADVTPEARIAGERAGVAGFLTKPLRPRDLRSAVECYARCRNQLPDERQYSALKTNGPVISNYLTNPQEIIELLDLGCTYDQARELIEDFFLDSRVLIDQAGEAATSGRIDGIREHMHAVKGAAAAIGAVELSHRTERIEKLDRTQAAITMMGEQQELQAILTRSKDALLRIARDSRGSS